MSKFEDLTGQKFGRLTVIERAENNKDGRARWKCRCDCGNEVVTTSSRLKNGDTKSCGCLKREKTSERHLFDLTGQRFGRLIVIGRADNHNGRVYWHCHCDCGNETVILAGSLIKGHSKSCGCLNREKTVTRNLKHGMGHTNIYHIWCGIKQRCLNPHRKEYKNYGGRGITIFPAWVDDFQAFYDYVSTLEHFGEDGYSIDRIDNNGNYEPNNLRYATRKEQRCNQRDNIIVEYRGELITLKEAAQKSSISYSTLRNRIKRGDTGDKLFYPAKK